MRCAVTPGHNYRPRTDAERHEEREERAAIMQYLGGVSREDAEARAAACVDAMAGGQLELGGVR